jgi:hypothetical protein
MKKPAKPTREAARGISLGGKPVSAAEFRVGFARRALVYSVDLLVWRYRFTGDPRWLREACAALRRGGMAVPRDLEAWARKAPRRCRGRPKSAEQWLKLADLLLAAEATRGHDERDHDERGRPFRAPLDRAGWQRWLASEMGLPVGHLRVLLHRLSDMPLASPTPTIRYRRISWPVLRRNRFRLIL